LADDPSLPHQRLGTEDRHPKIHELWDNLKEGKARLAPPSFAPSFREEYPGRQAWGRRVARAVRPAAGRRVSDCFRRQVGFAQALDYEARPHGVKVSVVAPGGVHTEFAIGTGREPGDPALAAMLDPDDVAAAVMFALTQPERSRVFLVGMRPMSELL